MNMQEDTFRTKGMRKRLVDELRSKNTIAEDVLEAIGKVPRHFFIQDSSFLPFAYENVAFPIGAGQTISHPYTVAFQSTLLQVKKGDKILEIGTGSGYQASVLASLGAKVFTIERHKSLHNNTSIKLPKWGYKCKFFYGDGFKGLPAFAPFDKIIVTCGAPFVPDALIEQLKPGGRMVIPVGEGKEQFMKLITKSNSGETDIEDYGTFSFVPMLENKS